MATRKLSSQGTKGERNSKRIYVSQTDVPSLTLDQALRIPKAIADHYAGRATKPLGVAQALGMTPSAGSFRALCGASIGYGLTEGGANSNSIALTELGKRVVLPLKEGDDVVARRESLLRPRVIGEFLRQYDQSKLPRPDIAKNVLVELKVPRDSAERTFSLIAESAKHEGLLRDIKGEQYVDLTGVQQPIGVNQEDQGSTDAMLDEAALPRLPVDEMRQPENSGNVQDEPSDATSLRMKRVFIAHGKNTSLLDPIKKLLSFGELEPVVSTERSSVAVPIPDKVMGDMRSCGAAIIHVDTENVLIDKEANEHVVLNPNVLIEIGASMALFGRRFILLVKEGTKLPSNLQGLHEVRYAGDSLDGNATIRLLEAINDIKNHALPLV